jgi:hypothetical protein
MFKITGLDKIQREFRDAGKALESLEGELGTVRFDPDDAASIEAAIVSMERFIDERTAAYADNSIIGPLVAEMKEKYRAGILDKASEARLAGVAEDGE